MIDMVNDQTIPSTALGPGRDIHNFSVHHYCQGSSQFAGPLCSHGIEGTDVLGGVPFVSTQAGIVIGIDNGVFALRQANASEWITIAQPAIPEQGYDDRLFQPGRYFDDQLDDFRPQSRRNRNSKHRIRASNFHSLWQGLRQAFHNWMDLRILCEKSGGKNQGPKRKCRARKE